MPDQWAGTGAAYLFDLVDDRWACTQGDVADVNPFLAVSEVAT